MVYIHPWYRQTIKKISFTLYFLVQHKSNKKIHKHNGMNIYIPLVQAKPDLPLQ